MTLNDNLLKVGWARDRHSYWWNVVKNSFPQLSDKPEPEFRLNIRPANFSGRAGRDRQTFKYYCEYRVCYFHEPNYDETICHEICHIAAHIVNGGYFDHGAIWKYFFNHVCQINRGRCHNYDTDLAKRIADSK